MSRKKNLTFNNSLIVWMRELSIQISHLLPVMNTRKIIHLNVVQLSAVWSLCDRFPWATEIRDLMVKCGWKLAHQFEVKKHLSVIFLWLNHRIVEFFLNVFTEFSEFSDKNNIILKTLLGLNSLSPAWETEILPLCHRHTQLTEKTVKLI